MVGSVESRNVVDWQEAFAAGEFDGEDVQTQIDAGWASWYCPDEEVPAKTQAFGKAIAKLQHGGKVDLEGCYVFFTETPWQESSFADFRITTMEEGNVEWKVTLDEPDDRFDKADMKGRKWHVYGGPNRQFKKPLKAFKTDATLAKWLNTAY